jgi:hypothetical protein
MYATTKSNDCVLFSSQEKIGFRHASYSVLVHNTAAQKTKPMLVVCARVVENIGLTMVIEVCIVTGHKIKLHHA